MLITTLASSSTGNAHLIDDGRTRLLLDCGIPWRQIQQKMGFQTASLAGVLVSHEHRDHCAAVHDAMKAGLDVYLSASTAGALELTGHRVKIVVSLELFRVGTWTVLPFSVEHDVPTMGFLVAGGKGKLLYLTDTAYCRYQFRGLSHIMIECNYATDILRENVENGIVSGSIKNRIIQSHFSLENVKEFLRANDLTHVVEIHLLHLSADNSDAERFKREIQEAAGKPVFIASERKF